MQFRSNPAGLRGSIAPVMTPFTSDGDVDLDAVRRMVRWQLKNGTNGISVGGSTGEPTALTIAERIDIMRAVAETTDDQVAFVPGTGSAKLDETLELTGAARDLGADAVLVVTPYYARPTQAGLIEWYSAVAREYPDLPIILYNVPFRAAVDVDPATVKTLMGMHDNIVGIKETTKDFEHVSRVIATCGRDVLVWCGIELLCLPTLALGGTGLISAAANIAPGAVAELAAAWDAGDRERALELHYGLHPLVDLLFLETNPAPGKWLLHRIGMLDSPYCRPPLAPMRPESVEKCIALYEQARELVPPALDPEDR